ncbi:MAG: NADH-quinone oxidoreductase subunit [Streptosporangiaceae bacterium]|nr:proton-translocating NADH-quinone oxidoreductase, chain [Streptosporangiaceae bacterium]MDX6430664.1 NADH-quinone oxidoreductase subunit [Streptosporangiaceae bacterium]
MIELAAATILLPFAAAFAGMLLGRRLPPAPIAVVPMAIATVLSAIVALTQWQDPEIRSGTLTMIPTGTVPIGVGLSVDGLAAAVAFMVCCVALAVQIYSVAYMRHEPAETGRDRRQPEEGSRPPDREHGHGHDNRYSSYAAFVSLFTAAMLLVVYAGDLVVLYVGWEIMGVCSYFLIGHHWEDRTSSLAAVKAFLVTRIGDVGFLFGIFVLGIGAHTFSLAGVLGAVPELPHGTLLAGTLLLLAGVAGKSAQFPLHTWLPDAMAGPTPISALIHAATMVAAGVYVVARLYPAFLAAPTSLAVLGVMAVISMLGAALAALAQQDLKRVLAYSTISQLAYMAAGLAVGSRNGAMFHLLTHGAFKAVLFLGAGCVITAVGSNLLRDYGGLRYRMPITFWSMTIGFAALAGIPPASGFFSKDSIVEAAQHSVLHVAGGIPVWTAWLIYLALLMTIAVTAAYAMRAWLMTFFGEPRSRTEAREAPPLMSWPVAALAIPALLLGLIVSLAAPDLRPHFGSAALSLLLITVGAGAAFLIWNGDPALDPARVLGPVRTTLERAFYVDEVYTLAFVRPVRALARVVVTADDKGIDAGVEGSATAARRLGGLLRLPQNGNPQSYLTGLLTGVVVIVLAVVILI